MWTLAITNPKSEPLQVKVVPGKMAIGRMDTCDIVINDAAASRRHAEIFYDPLPELVTIKDLKSSNGTYVNRQRITGLVRMQSGDVIRIGSTQMHLSRISDTSPGQKGITGTCLFTRELVLEAVDEHPIILQEITEKLNTVTDVDTAINEVVETIKQAMGADICQIILAEDFKNVPMDNPEDLIVRTIRNASVETSPMAICVPVVSAGKPLALIYIEKQRKDARPFDKRDMQLAVAISHQTTLTIQRIELLARIRREGELRQLLLRFVSPIEADDILKDYLKTGHFPELAEKKATVMFVEPADSTAMAERIGPKNFSAFMSSFYDYVTQAVFRKGGMVKYLGDGVLALFTEIKNEAAPEDRAVSAATEIISFVKKSEPPEANRPYVVGVAINTGKALVGYVGSQDRAEFNVMGNLIKVTYRMQEYAIPNRIFVGASTADAIRNKYLVQKTGSLGMRGNDQPVQVYEVSYVKTAPFVESAESDKDKDGMMSAAFKAIAEKLKARSEKVDSENVE